MDSGQSRVANFYMDKVLGGDIIVEQNIHVIDVANWFLQGHPAEGQRHRRTHRLERNAVQRRRRLGSLRRDLLVPQRHPRQLQFAPAYATASSDLCVRCFGIKGSVDSHYGGTVRILGQNAWMGAEKDDTFKQGAINNVKAFIDSIRTGNLLNNAEQAVESNLTAILGRTAAYLGRTVTWDEMMNSTEKLEANLKLRW